MQGTCPRLPRERPPLPAAPPPTRTACTLRVAPPHTFPPSHPDHCPTCPSTPTTPTLPRFLLHTFHSTTYYPHTHGHTHATVGCFGTHIEGSHTSPLHTHTLPGLPHLQSWTTSSLVGSLPTFPFHASTSFPYPATPPPAPSTTAHYFPYRAGRFHYRACLALPHPALPPPVSPLSHAAAGLSCTPGRGFHLCGRLLVTRLQQTIPTAAYTAWRHARPHARRGEHKPDVRGRQPDSRFNGHLKARVRSRMYWGTAPASFGALPRSAGAWVLHPLHATAHTLPPHLDRTPPQAAPTFPHAHRAGGIGRRWQVPSPRHHLPPSHTTPHFPSPYITHCATHTPSHTHRHTGPTHTFVPLLHFHTATSCRAFPHPGCPHTHHHTTHTHTSIPPRPTHIA